jgi:hypothetical protein
MPDSQNWGRDLFKFRGEFLGQPVKEESEELLVKLKLLLGGKLVQSLANLRLLAEVKMDLSLLRPGFLFRQGKIEPLEGLKLLVELMGSFLVKLALRLEEGVIGSLVKLWSLLEQKMVQPLVNLCAEGKRFPQDGPPIFLLQMSDED